MSILTILETYFGITKLGQHYEIIIFTPIIYHIIFILGGKLSSYLFPKTYNNYTKHEKILWNEHIIHFLNSIVLCALSVPLLFDKELEKDKLFGYSLQSGNVYAVASGYFIWDLIMCLNRKVPSGFFIIHASLCVLVYLISLTPFLNYYGIRFLLFELSTPFLNIGWFLQKLNLTNTLLFKANGIILFIVFFFARIVWGFYQSYYFWIDISSTFFEGPKHLAIIIGFANICLNSLNIIWFSKLFGLLLNMIMSKSKSDKKVNTDNKVENGNYNSNGNVNCHITNTDDRSKAK